MIVASCSLSSVVCYPYGGLELMKWIFCLVAFCVGLFFYNSQCHAKGGKSGPPAHLSIGDTFLLDLDYGDMEVGDQKQEGTAEIQLNQEISRRYPYAEFDSYVIEKVDIVAKSSDGKAQAELLLDLNSLTIKSIPKAHGSFLSKELESYDQVELVNAENVDQGGAWEIQLRGHFIIHSAVLHLKVINKNFGSLRIDSDSSQVGEPPPSPTQSKISEGPPPSQAPPVVDKQPAPEPVPEPELVPEPEIELASDPNKLQNNNKVEIAAPPRAVPPEATPPEVVPPRKNMGATLVSVIPKRQSPPYHEVSLDLGLDEIFGQSQRRVSFPVNKNNIVGVKISCVAGSTEIIEVVAVLRDGSRRSLSELHGPIMSGDELVVDLGFAIPIKEILVVSQGRGRRAGDLARYQLTAIQLQR
ncbi:MAG: hypothetical protein IPK68_14040 [Bdellovibrionales bacterium]|nr:hypothetical protein [Bdellovibrionales bacterium]